MSSKFPMSGEEDDEKVKYETCLVAHASGEEDLFGHDARPRPPGKQRPTKKSKSDATACTGGSSALAQFGELMEQELRLKRKAAERAFEAPHTNAVGGVEVSSY
ncbi:hypothetical protein Tco_0977960 [Tanacetum coccineum]|uniref:Uncharacterized protein n=1 Tax=Tanacetum coccineum TaxID=301880 RepID=A0ABQ5EM18_9ASTR